MFISEIIDGLWDRSIFTFLGVSAIPIFIIWNSHRIKYLDRGYYSMLIGSIVAAIACLLDYLEDTKMVGPALKELTDQTFLFKDGHFHFLYFIGAIGYAHGIASWFPVLNRVADEVEQRKKVERELKIVAEELNRTALAAESANQAKSEFLASMSHEIRTPLNAVLGYAQMVREEFYGKLEGDKNKQYMNHIIDSGSHLLEILNDILDLSKLEAGKIQVERTSVSVLSVVNDALSCVRPMLEAKGHKLDINVSDVSLQTDPRLVRQILINILSNSIKFTPDGGQLSCKGEVSKGMYVLTLTDNGVGMTQAEQDMALEPFNQVQTQYVRDHEGTGLGLPIVKRYVELLGGTFKLTSEKGEGTEARVMLPRF